MKKTTLTFVAACFIGAAFSANAQESFVVEDPTIAPSIATCKDGGIYDVFALGDAGMEQLRANSNITVNDYRGGDDANSHYPGGNVGWASDDVYNTITPTADGRGFDGFQVHGNWYQWWSGFYMTRKADTDLTHLNADSHLHIAFQLVGDINVPYVNVQWFKADGNDGTAPAIAFTEDVIDNKYPVVASLKKGEWVAVDITLGKVAELMKDEFDIDMDYTRFVNDWQGEAVAISLHSGQDHANGGTPLPEFGHEAIVFVDGAYVYTPSGKASVGTLVPGADDIQVIVSDKTISVLGNDNAPVQLYNMSGSLVKTSTTSVIGSEDLVPGVYVVKTLHVAKKVIIR